MNTLALIFLRLRFTTDDLIAYGVLAGASLARDRPPLDLQKSDIKSASLA